MLWFKFILGLNFIFFCFKIIIIHYHTQKQKKIKFKPRMKLNHNIYMKFSEILLPSLPTAGFNRVNTFLNHWSKTFIWMWEIQQFYMNISLHKRLLINSPLLALTKLVAITTTFLTVAWSLFWRFSTFLPKQSSKNPSKKKWWEQKKREAKTEIREKKAKDKSQASVHLTNCGTEHDHFSKKTL